MLCRRIGSDPSSSFGVTVGLTFVSCNVENVIQGGSNMTGTDLCLNKPHCTAAVRP